MGLPNGSSTTQEMDQCYAEFQPDFHKSVVRVAAEKIAVHVLARKKAKANRDQPKAADLCALTKERFAEDIEEHGGPFEDDDNEMTIVVGKKLCSIYITNCDLPTIVNGKATYPIELQPFDY